MRSYYKPGSWNALCDICGFKHKSDELRLRWDGLMVCNKDWETRHPQDLIRVPTDNPSVPWSRGEPSDSFITFYLVTETGAIISTESGDTISYVP